MSDLAMWIVLAVLLVLSAFSSATETALTSVNRVKIRHLAEEKVPSALRLEKLLKQPSRFLATILLLNNLVNIGAASLATVLTARYFEHYVVAISTGVMTFIILVYGEITPKSFAAQNAEKIALWAARPVSILQSLLYPIVHAFIFIANLFIRLLGGKTMKEGPFLTEEEIKTIVSVGEEEGVIEEEEKRMIHSIFEFGDTIVREVMVPRIDMVCVESSDSVEKALQLITKEGYSRLPVFEENIDNVVGILYARDLLVRFSKGKAGKPLKELVRPAYFIPETKKVNDLMRELQEGRQHMAIVVDEYGQTAGLVTMEDLLEEIVGEIYDEYDLEETLIEAIGKDRMRIDARVALDKVEEELGLKLPESEADTIGGFVYSLIGRIPAEGEKVVHDNLTFTVEKVEGRRISKILITKQSSPGKEFSPSG